MHKYEDFPLYDVNYIVVVDREFNIIFNARYETNINQKAQIVKREEYLGRKFSEVYPQISEKDSTIVQCIRTGKVFVRRGQKVVDFKGKEICSDNITIPILCEGKIMGAIELARDVTTAGWISDEMKKGTREHFTFDDILTTNEEVKAAIEKAKILAHLPNPTLIYGETGTGKELFSQAMITESGVDPSKAIIQNCAAIPENLFESILFGTQKGIYTGAENKNGLFEEADGGVLFLDELNAMPYSVQGKLLRMLQNGTFRKLGSNREQRVKVKIIAAMNIDPVEAMEKKIIRPDLFYRFSSGMIYIPPLRERTDDLEFYLDYFLKEFNERYHKEVRGFEESLLKLLRGYCWDGNVRELKHMLESMISLTKSEVLQIKDLPKYAYDKMTLESLEEGKANRTDRRRKKNLNLRIALEEKERLLILEALDESGWNHTKASALLGIPRATLNYKIKKLGLDVQPSDV